MASYIGATGVQLPEPFTLYPVTINNVPGIAGTNRLSLPPGGDVLIPAGRFAISPGLYSQVQIQDPVTNLWLPYSTATTNEVIMVDSDGVNYRVTNIAGYPIGAIVNVSGSGFTSAPAVTSNVGGSTWVAVVGGAVSAINCATGGSGTGYAVPPLVNIAVPPTPGVPATATCAISGGAISSFTIVNPGAGYTSPPAVVFSPQPTDLNFASGTTVTKNATATTQLSFGGQITAVLMTNEGNNTLSVAPALTFTGGGGSGAVATVLLAQTITAITVTSGGTGYPAGVAITSAGGTLVGQTSGIGAGTNNPMISTGLLIPRPCQIAATQGSGTGVQIGTIIDGGLFTSQPFVYAVPPPTSGAVATTGQAAFGLTMGGLTDTIIIQPL